MGLPRRCAQTVGLSSPLFLPTVALLSACVPSSIPTTGVTGVGIDDQGELIGYIAMCDGHVDGAVLYETDGPTLGQWDAPARVEGFATWSLSEPGDWVAVRTYRAPTGDAEYRLYGGNSDSSASSSHVTFHRRDLSDLTPGQVPYWAGSLKATDEQSFRNEACADAGMPLR